MKFRGRSSIAADDKVVSTAVAKKQWFLKDLTGLPSLKAGWNGATFYAVKDLDRLALKVHGPEGLAKKKLTRQKRLDKKTEKAPKKKNAKPEKKKRKEREGDAEAAINDDDVDDGLHLRKKRATKDDDDFVPDKQDKRRKKDEATESNRRLSVDQVSLQKRNHSLDGSWVLQDFDDVDGDLVLKLAKNGKTMSGNCVISGCQVRLKCSDLQTEELDFHSVFKTQKTSFVGRMLIHLLDKGNAIKISYSNGASGQAAVRFLALSQKRESKKCLISLFLAL